MKAVRFLIILFGGTLVLLALAYGAILIFGRFGITADARTVFLSASGGGMVLAFIDFALSGQGIHRQSDKQTDELSAFSKNDRRDAVLESLRRKSEHQAKQPRHTGARVQSGTSVPPRHEEASQAPGDTSDSDEPLNIEEFAREKMREVVRMGDADGKMDERLSQVYQAIAARKDAKHKAELKKHSERVLPQADSSDLDIARRSATACLAIRHVFPPRLPQSSLTFLGGVPLGPDGLGWPMVHNRDGLLEYLSFVGQIELDKLPDGPGRALLPDHGILYFFAPLSGNFAEDSNHFVVRYVDSKPDGDWGYCDHLSPEPLYGTDASHYFDWLSWHDDPRRHLPRFLKRNEIELGWIENPSENNGGAADSDSGFPWERAANLRTEALVRFHNPGSFDAGKTAFDGPAAGNWIKQDDFPVNGRFAEVLTGHVKSWLKSRRELIAYKAGSASGNGFDHVRRDEAVRFHDELRKRHAFALDRNSAPPGDLIDGEQRAGLLTLIDELKRIEFADPLADASEAKFLRPDMVDKWIASAIVESMETAVNDPKTAHLVPQAIVAGLYQRHNAIRMQSDIDRNEIQQHQMFGHGDIIQSAAGEMPQEGYVLLLQLRPDPALGLYIGDNGAMQYWIHVSDLAAKRFENAILTVECH